MGEIFNKLQFLQDTRSLSQIKLKEIVSEIQSCEESSSDPINDFASLAYYDTIVAHESTYHVSICS